MSIQSKYDILRQYRDENKPELIRDTWMNLGGAIAGPQSRTFIKDMLYRINLSNDSGDTDSGDVAPATGSDLEGAIVICESSYYGTEPLDWHNAAIEDETDGFFSFAYGIITPYFRLLLTNEEVEAITEPWDPNFIPYTEINTAEVIVPEQELELILLETGVPFLTLDELEFPRNKIVNLMVAPAMQDYFKFFPIVRPEVMNQSVAVAGQEFEFKMPEGAYGALRAFINQGYSGTTGNAMGNPLHFFANEVVTWGGGAGWSPLRHNQNRSPGFANLQGFGTMALDRAARQGIVNYAARFHFRIERRGRDKYLVGYANKAGAVEVHWAFASNNWMDIDYARQPEVRKLAAARALRALGMLRSQIKADIPGQVDYSGFITRAKELEDGVFEFWNNIPRTAMVRGGIQ